MHLKYLKCITKLRKLRLNICEKHVFAFSCALSLWAAGRRPQWSLFQTQSFSLLCFDRLLQKRRPYINKWVAIFLHVLSRTATLKPLHESVLNTDIKELHLLLSLFVRFYCSWMALTSRDCIKSGYMWFVELAELN